MIDPHRVLVLPLTLKADLNSDECNAIATWVEEGHGLLALGTYLMERHHETNMNELLRRLGLQFSHDLIMPDGKDDDRSCRKQAIGVDRSVAVMTQPRGNPAGHAILDSVGTISFQSACTVESEVTTDLVVETEAVCSRMNANGRREQESNRLMLIDDYVVQTRGHLPFLVALRAGLGRVVALGSWKIFLNDFVDDPQLDNKRLFRNCIRWLSGSD